ncbi:MAG: thermonuclease family protein [Gammaproteobacteria bacterium]
MSIALAWPAAAADISGLARVRADGSLELRGRTVVLWGIHIPRTHDDCLAHRRPLRCGQAASLALEQLIEGFVRCEPRARLDHRFVAARCVANYGHFDDGVDLAAYLLNRGWAVASRDAPAGYHLHEAVARNAGLGIWGLPLRLRP